MKGGHSMRRTIGALTLAGALALGVSGTASAQARGYVMLGGGASIPVGDFGDFASTGWVGQVAGGITLPTGIVGGRISGTFAQHKLTGTDNHFRILGAMGDVVVSPTMSGKVGVYVLGGAGFQNGKATGDEGVTKFAWNAGGGLKARAGSLGVFVEARFLSVRTPGASSNSIPITAGVRLGGN